MPIDQWSHLNPIYTLQGKVEMLHDLYSFNDDSIRYT